MTAPAHPLDRLDPRSRILGALAAVVTAVALTRPAALGLGLLAALAGAWAARLSPRAVAARLVHVEGFLIVMVALLPFTIPGAPAFALGPLAASGPGLERALLVLLRVNLAALVILTLVAGLEPVRFGRALAGLGVPDRLVRLFLFTLRWVDLLRAEAGRLGEAMRARAFTARTSRHTLRTLGQLAGLLFVRALDRAERVHEAMRCRGYAGRFPHPPAERPGRADLAFAAALAFGLGLLFALDRAS